ncbi:hypothetical protein QFW77_03145 [Luteimonas sp. RD2P54]|uniref:Uncharacterized protein n=1 Tax=Luteimonas endophytica TaxID=3042023 RepID=A0ABT6J5W9_9GAMM|nr:hypothetical protein [Luteimonas endophytica]MDH5821990.1 hypothetical protein [Luteimonas endophytica]
MFRKRNLYLLVFRDHFMGRVVGEDRRARRDCHALDNTRGDPDFSRVGKALKSLVEDLAPGFSLRKPTALLHFIPEHYAPTQRQLALFKRTAERSGISRCWLSTWETPNTDRELAVVFRSL